MLVRGSFTSLANSVFGRRRKLENERRQVADKVAADKRATEAQLLEDAERLIDAWNERQ
jgi:hypothetical protein